jgi:hypothetical protein
MKYFMKCHETDGLMSNVMKFHEKSHYTLQSDFHQVFFSLGALKQNQCGRSIACLPCELRMPDCTNEPNGDRPVPLKLFTPEFVKCKGKNEYFYEMSTFIKCTYSSQESLTYMCL